jgi:hypothetical protein
MADGTPVQAAVHVPHEVHGLATFLTLVPTAAPPPGAPLSVVMEGLVDPSGNATVSPGKPLQTVNDVNGALDNGGFERGLDGWLTTGAVIASEVVADLAPPAGARQAVLKSPARLVGAIDVPVSSTSLTFWAAAVSEGAGFDRERSAVVWLVADGERWPMFDAAARTPRSPRVAPAQVSIDVTRWRGRRVLVVAETRGSGYFGFNYHTLLVDDFTIR